MSRKIVQGQRYRFVRELAETGTVPKIVVLTVLNADERSPELAELADLCLHKPSVTVPEVVERVNGLLVRQER